ncbi:MAG: LLM class F420-dependent oxidoreductase [Gammaproteobacteria bacterium PRO9]|nr:LLM class F420-dependent oxidoreductase [Gammaproteobacteria bacterium PRO9]
MRLGLVAGYSSASLHVPMDEILEAERLGFDSVWTSEAYGSDAVSVCAWILAQTTRIRVGTAIMQMPARTPTCAAMTANTLNALSGGRFLLGLGPSGPQVVEGWYGVPYGLPMTRTREYIDIIRQVCARRGPLKHQGHHYRIPYDGPNATGLGRPMMSILHGDPAMKIYTAAATPAGFRTAAEVADGVFPIWMDPRRFELIGPFLEEGFRKRVESGGTARTLADFDVAPAVLVSMGDDLAACQAPVRAHLSLYIGGMGPRQKNFYAEYATRMGFGDDARKIQDLYLGGRKAEAAAAVPTALIDAIALVGPAGRIRERLADWVAAGRAGHVSTMLVTGASIDALRLLASELL